MLYWKWKAKCNHISCLCLWSHGCLGALVHCHRLGSGEDIVLHIDSPEFKIPSMGPTERISHCQVKMLEVSHLKLERMNVRIIWNLKNVRLSGSWSLVMLAVCKNSPGLSNVQPKLETTAPKNPHFINKSCLHIMHHLSLTLKLTLLQFVIFSIVTSPLRAAPLSAEHFHHPQKKLFNHWQLLLLHPFPQPLASNGQLSVYGFAYSGDFI